VAKRKPLRKGDVIRLKPIALLIAEKQVQIVGHKTEGHNYYSGGPFIDWQMTRDWNSKEIAVYQDELPSMHYIYVKFVKEGEGWGINRSWISSVKRKKD